MIEPIERSFEVGCSVEHAFDVWTQKIALWWPLSGHSVARENAVSVFIEPRVGGTIVERTRDGGEHTWGRVTRWEPPRRLGYHWFLGQDEAEASQVEIVFEPRGAERTRVSIVHTGFERSGPKAEGRRRGNLRGWDGVLPTFIAYAEEKERP